MWIRKLVIIASLMFATTNNVRAEVGLGVFFGEPTGLDLKLDLAPQSALDILFGWYNRYNDFNSDSGYAHLTYLFQPFVTHGRSVVVPLRIGIGVAVFDDRGRFDDDINIAARFPFEVGIRFKRTPVEIYGEIALKLTLLDGGNNDHPTLDLDGGLGLRFYF